MRRPVQPESAMRGAGGIRADIAPEKKTDGRDGRGAGMGHERLRDSHRQASKIIGDMKAAMGSGRKGKGGERVFGQR
jgi:hypothetical protein